MATKCVAFHSYKGGAGKTTIASNCAALLAKKGFKVALLDLDVYAPSLNTYFGSVHNIFMVGNKFIPLLKGVGSRCFPHPS